jgi:hypothetical protein
MFFKAIWQTLLSDIKDEIPTEQNLAQSNDF